MSCPALALTFRACRGEERKMESADLFRVLVLMMHLAAWRVKAVVPAELRATYMSICLYCKLACPARAWSKVAEWKSTLKICPLSGATLPQHHAGVHLMGVSGKSFASCRVIDTYLSIAE